MPPKTADRIEVVDALRGIALFAIVIVHCLEHYTSRKTICETFSKRFV